MSEWFLDLSNVVGLDPEYFVEKLLNGHKNRGKPWKSNQIN